jgi:tRNA A37 methylthiotransferase MiaB
MHTRKKACILTLGCPESRIDSARVQLFLRKNSYAITRKIKEADLILLRTCGLTENNEKESLEAIRNIKLAKKKDATFLAWGCLSKINPSALKREYSDLTFGEIDEENLNEFAEAEMPIEDIHANEILPKFKNRTSSKNILRSSFHFLVLLLGGGVHPICRWEKSVGSPFFIKVSSGCLGGCTFCAVKKSRGTLRSKSVDSVLVEFKKGLASGYKDFRLLATDLGAYGRDKGYRLVDLLSRMIEEEGRYVISLRNVNPCWFIEMYEDMKPILASGKIRFISSAFQSGSNRILQLMGRRYTIEEYKRCFQDLNREYPDILLSTQVMAGFPTETEQDFQRSERILKEIRFDKVEVYRYSSRSGTSAAKLDGHVSEYIKLYRFLRLFFVSTLMRALHKK